MAKKKRLNRANAPPSPGTVGELVEFLLGRQWRREPKDDFLGWPPDTFAVAATLLRETGAYVNVLGKWPPPHEHFSNLSEYAKWINEQGQRWAEQLEPPDFKSVEAAAGLWREVYNHRDCQRSDCSEVWESLVQLCALADEASEWLTPIVCEEPASQDGVSLLAAENDDLAGNGASMIPWAVLAWMLDNVADDLVFSNLCSDSVSRSNVIVLPKMRTPQNGITIRSLSHNLALLPNVEVRPKWQLSRLGEPGRLREGMNLLLFPWPMAVHPVQFHPVPPSPERPVADRFRFFEFHSQDDAEESVNRVSRAYEVACQRFGRIDGVIFPEMALDPHAFDMIVRSLARKDVALVVGGVYERQSGAELAQNSAKIACFYGTKETDKVRYEREQQKHHRWMLDDSQIRSYGLGSMLNPQYGWWEHIGIGERTLEFMQLDRSLAMAVLICEDLARPDPVGDVIRAVGPNLVIALLQDGPQLTGRWSARYATVLADDPGCSVLTLTGLGMTQLSRPANIKAPSRVVALWKQADSAAREIELPVGAEALVLCLSHEQRDQWTADGRHDQANAGHVTLSGVHAVTMP